MQDKRLTEQRTPRSSRIDALSSIQIVGLINSEDRTVALAVVEESLGFLEGAAGAVSQVVGDLP